MAIRSYLEILIDVDLKLKYSFVLESANWLFLPVQEVLQWWNGILFVKDLTSYLDLTRMSKSEQQCFIEDILTQADVTIQEFLTSPVKISGTLDSEGRLLVERIEFKRPLLELSDDELKWADGGIIGRGIFSAL